MPTDRIGEPWAGATYNGFSGPAAFAAPKPARREAINRKTVIGGLAAATAAGLLFGLWARPDFGDDGRARGPMTAAPPAAEAPVARVPVEVMPPVVTPAPKADGPLEVLPQDLARAAEAARPVAPAPAARAPAGSAASATVAAPPPPVAVVTPRPAPPPVVERDRFADREPGVTPSFNCRYARSRSEQMVCGDSELATLDRRLNRAFDRAVGSGVPYRELRREQDDWLAIREDAARRSPEAVASIYRQRIRELNAIAEGGF